MQVPDGHHLDRRAILAPFDDARAAARDRSRRQLSTALLAAAILLPLATVAIGSWFAWRNAWHHAEEELARSADATAEYAGRVLGAHRLAAELVNHMLTGLTDAEIRAREEELHRRLAAIVPLLPMTNTIALSDRDARVLLTANVFPVPPIAIPDREWVVALRRPDAPPVHVSSLTTGRLDTNFFFGVSVRRRLSGNRLPGDDFDGVVNVSVNPLQFANGLEAITRAPTDSLALIRQDGELLARYPAFDVRLPPIPAGSPFRAAAAAGEQRGTYTGLSALGLPPQTRPGEPLLVAFRRLGDLPVYATAARTRAAILVHWREETLQLLAVGVPAAAILLGLGLMMQRSQRQLAAREADFRATFERSPIGKVLADPATSRFLRVNDRFCEIAGRDRAELLGGLGFVDITHPEDRDAKAEEFFAAMAGNHEYVVEKRLLRRDGGIVWVRVNAAVIPEGSGWPARTIAAVQDITERRANEASRVLLAREVDHRAKNALAVVQSIVRLSRAEEPGRLADLVQGRIAALSRAHTLLAEESWAGAELERVLRNEVAAFLDSGRGGQPRVALRGPSVSIAPNAVQPLAMAIHELAINAAKHGALSAAEGRVTVTWRLDPAQRDLDLTWCERGGPPVSPPGRTGFGSAVMDATIRRQLGGELDFAWDHAGLRCALRLPGRHVQVPGAEQGG